MKKSEGGLRISCMVFPRIFSSERGVEINLPDGNTVTAFVDKSFLDLKEEPQASTAVAGFLTVVLVEREKARAILELPGAASAFASGSRFAGLPSMLERIPA